MPIPRHPLVVARGSGLAAAAIVTAASLAGLAGVARAAPAEPSPRPRVSAPIVVPATAAPRDPAAPQVEIVGEARKAAERAAAAEIARNRPLFIRVRGITFPWDRRFGFVTFLRRGPRCSQHDSPAKHDSPVTHEPPTQHAPSTPAVAPGHAGTGAPRAPAPLPAARFAG